MIAFSFGACKSGTDTGNSETHNNNSNTTAAKNDALKLRIVNGVGTDHLTLAGEGKTEVFTLSTDNLTVLFGEEPKEAVYLENGMILEFDPGYEISETWPLQITKTTAVHAQSKIEDADDYGDICGLYLQVLEDLWEEDNALNEDIKYVSIYLDEAPGKLTDAEKTAITWIISGKHFTEGLQLSLEELQEKGYLDENDLFWKDGVLLSIKQTKAEKSNSKKITFDAEKWRSGLGAIFFNKCKSERGTAFEWEPYKCGSFAIS